MGARVLLLPCNCKGILSCKRFFGYRQENTRRSTAEHWTDYGMHLLSDVATKGRRRFLQTIRIQQAGRNE